MTSLDAHDLVRPDATIRYWSGGIVGGRTVVLLRGATLDHRAWAPQVEVLPGAQGRGAGPCVCAAGRSAGGAGGLCAIAAQTARRGWRRTRPTAVRERGAFQLGDDLLARVTEYPPPSDNRVGDLGLGR